MKNTNKNRGIFIVTTIVGAMILLKANYTYNMGNQIVEKKGEIDNQIVKEVKEKEDSKIVKEEKEKVGKRVKETFVFAKVTKCTPYYDNYSCNRKEVGNLKKDEIVEVIRDMSYEWYLVKSKNGKCGWVSKNVLSIPKDPETNNDKMTQEEIENYVNSKGLKSDTSYLVWVNIDRQLTHVFLGEEGNWRLHKTMLSATGKNISPTIKGIFKIQDRGEWFYTERLNSGAKYWVRFNGPYLFHSLPMDRQKNIIDNTLGKRVSSGCIRLSLEDSKWFYDHIKEGSTVFVN